MATQMPHEKGTGSYAVVVNALLERAQISAVDILNRASHGKQRCGLWFPVL